MSATVGILLLPILVWAYSRGSQTFRNMSNDMLLLIAALVFFGVFLDKRTSPSSLDRW